MNINQIVTSVKPEKMHVKCVLMDIIKMEVNVVNVLIRCQDVQHVHPHQSVQNVMKQKDIN